MATRGPPRPENDERAKESGRDTLEPIDLHQQRFTLAHLHRQMDSRPPLSRDQGPVSGAGTGRSHTPPSPSRKVICTPPLAPSLISVGTTTMAGLCWPPYSRGKDSESAVDFGSGSSKYVPLLVNPEA